MERLSTLYNADVGLYMLANKVIVYVCHVMLVIWLKICKIQLLLQHNKPFYNQCHVSLYGICH